MSAPTIADLKAAWSRRDYSTNETSRAAIGLLADGRPVTPEALATATGLSLDQVQSYLENVN